jgi:hypothetical protein
MNSSQEKKVPTNNNQGHASEQSRIPARRSGTAAIGGLREVHAWSNRPIWPQGNMKLRRSICCVMLLCLWALSSPVVSAQNPTITEAQREFFEKKIRPVLAEQCYDCHNSNNKKKGGLALDWSQPLRQGGGFGGGDHTR